MNINNILNDVGDTEDVRQSLLHVKLVLQTAAYDYAHAALEAANEVVKSVQAAAPAVAVWSQLHEFQKFSNKSHAALQATTQATGMLLMAEETGDDQVDSLNQEAKISSIDVPTISSMLEGAAMRINIAIPGIPQSGAPGERCNPTVLNQQNQGSG
jgi:hypothetical protein